MKVKLLRHVWLFATPWSLAYQAPLSMGFSRQEYWSGLPFPSPGDLPNPRTEAGSPALQADALPSELPEKASNTVTSSMKTLKMVPVKKNVSSDWRAICFIIYFLVEIVLLLSLLELIHPSIYYWSIIFLQYCVLGAQHSYLIFLYITKWSLG